MKKQAENLFFRYDPKLKNSITNETYAHCAYYLLDYEKFIQKRPNKFIDFLLDIPEPIFGYYYQLMTNSPAFSDILLHPDITARLLNMKNEPLLSELKQSFDESNYVTYCFPLFLSSLLVGVYKENPKFNNSNDFLLFIEKGDIKVIELLTDYRKTSASGDQIFSKNKELIFSDASAFKEKQRLQLLFT